MRFFFRRIQMSTGTNLPERLQPMYLYKRREECDLHTKIVQRSKNRHQTTNIVKLAIGVTFHYFLLLLLKLFLLSVVLGMT